MCVICVAGMVVNIIMSSASLRTGESWTPVCLSQYNDKGFAYAYISFIEGTFLFKIGHEVVVRIRSGCGLSLNGLRRGPVLCNQAARGLGAAL